MTAVLPTAERRWHGELAVMLEPVADWIADHAEELSLRQLEAARTLPSYLSGDRVPDDCLIASCQRNVDRVAATLREGRPPEIDEIHEAWVFRERADQGVPADEILNGYRMVQRLLCDAFIDAATQVDLDGRVMVRGTRLLWEMADSAVSALLVVRHERELELACHEESQKMDFLRGLCFGSLTASEISERAVAYGLSLDRPYYVLRGRPQGASPVQMLKRAVEAACDEYGRPGLVGVVDGDVVGLTPQQPRLTEASVVLGVGGPSPLQSMEHAFRAASRMLDVAIRFGQTGAQSMADLSLRVAVASEPELGRLLMERYVAPLQGEGEFGAMLEETMREFIANGQRVLETARNVCVHPNTLRYRLDRYEKLTGVKLSNPRTLTELWWALECRELERRSQQMVNY